MKENKEAEAACNWVECKTNRFKAARDKLPEDKLLNYTFISSCPQVFKSNPPDFGKDKL